MKVSDKELTRVTHIAVKIFKEMGKSLVKQIDKLDIDDGLKVGILYSVVKMLSSEFSADVDKEIKKANKKQGIKK